MDFIKDLTGSLLWAPCSALFLYIMRNIAIGFRRKIRATEAYRPEPHCTFLVIGSSLHLGSAKFYPERRVGGFFSGSCSPLPRSGSPSMSTAIFSWSMERAFPAAFKNIITAGVLVVVVLILLRNTASTSPRS
jgi:hypothetical protein